MQLEPCFSEIWIKLVSDSLLLSPIFLLALFIFSNVHIYIFIWFFPLYLYES